MALVTQVLDRGLMGVYLYGSAVVGGLRRASDLDLLAVSSQRTSPAQRRALIRGLRPLSSRAQRPAAWRPVELTIVARPDVVPWRYPPRLDFQSGEWLRSAFDAGRRRPWTSPNTDLAIVLAQARLTATPLLGRPAAELLPVVPGADLRRAMTDEIPSLLADLDTDTANVLLTLARIWYTLAMGAFVAKDVAAAWSIQRLPNRDRGPLERARAAYLGLVPGTWLEQDAWQPLLPAAHRLSKRMVGYIERQAPVATIHER